MNRLIWNCLSEERWPWWNRIDEHILLGGIPLRGKKHLTNLLSKASCKVFQNGELQVREGLSVVTLLEDFELFSKNIFFTPISPKDWEKLGVAVCHIQTADFSPLLLEDIYNALDFMEEQVQKGKIVYVHCKAGRGRSATVVICYLIRKYRWSVREALSYVKYKRPLICPNKSQLEIIEEFYRQLSFV